MGLKPEACFRPLEDQDWMGVFAPLWHAFVKYSDGSTDSITGGEGAYTSEHTPCYEGDKRSDDECKCWTWDRIEQCIKDEAAKDTARYDIFTNNCGQWVKRKFLACCLENPIPWWLIYDVF